MRTEAEMEIRPPGTHGRWGAAIGLSIGLALALGLPSCEEADSSSGSGGETGGPPQPLDGHWVTCCFRGNFDSVIEGQYHAYGCTEIMQPCIDPEVWDADSSGELEEDELFSFCEQKCDPAWPVDTLNPPPWNYYDPATGNTVAHPDVTDAFNSCIALPPASSLPSHIEEGDEFRCEPQPVESYGENIEIPPTHVGSFASAGGQSEVEIKITGNVMTPAYTLDVHFAITDCDGGGIDGGVCRVVLSAFDFDITSEFKVGDYEVKDAELSLASSVSAYAFFDPCVEGQCVGTFEFSQAEGNPVGMNLLWSQQHTFLPSADDAGLYLANDGKGLGGMDELLGELTLAQFGGSGTLELTGTGADALGGDWATVNFALEGDVKAL